MDKKTIVSSAEDLLDEFRSLLNGMNAALGKLPQVEIDLAKEKIRLIYDLLLELEKINSEINESDAAKSLPPEEEPKEERTPNIVNVQILQMEDEESEIETEELILEENIPSKPDLRSKKGLGSLDLFAEPSVISDVEMKKTVVDKIAEGKKEQSVADKMQKNKILGLKAAIGINEKFFFINELFEGNMKDYNEAIEKLDNCESIELANQLVSSYSDEREWDQESDALSQLQGFIDRKFK
ncbi:MAG: hypothetical protein R2764_09140 [Bacteroidales bacterium]